MEGTPYISAIVLKNRQTISLAVGGTLAIVGPNNAGKTYFLKSIRSHLHAATVEEISLESGIIESLEIQWRGAPTAAIQNLRERTQKSFRPIGDNFVPDNGIKYPNNGIIKDTDYQQQPKKNSPLGPFTDLFLQFDDALERTQETKLQRQVRPEGHNGPSLTQLARENPSADENIKHYFKRIFHKDISYYDQGYGQIGFLLAPEVEGGSLVGGALNMKTQHHMENSAKLWLQGLGMRSVLGLLLRIFAGGQEIIIIDEPEAFLHPPQASGLGAVLAEISAKHHKQIILATHDRNILNGLTKESKNNIIIQRLNRQDNQTAISSIPASTLNDVRARSLIRYSPLFDSLFTQITVLVENEKDAFFYSEAINYLLETNSVDYPNFTVDDILFLSTSGKGALGRTAELATSLHSKVIIACDFDLLVDFQQLEAVMKGIGAAVSKIEDLKKKYEALMDLVFDDLNADQKQKNSEFENVKNRGIRFGDTLFQQKASTLIKELDDLGICLNHLGELEDFSPELVGKRTKSEWVNHAIQKNIHQDDDAQIFAKRILHSAFGMLPVSLH